MRSIACIAAALLAAASAARAEPFRTPAADGYPLTGQVDRPAGESGRPRVVVLMVPGTGLFDRDVAFGRSGPRRTRSSRRSRPR